MLTNQKASVCFPHQSSSKASVCFPHQSSSKASVCFPHQNSSNQGRPTVSLVLEDLAESLKS